MATEIILHPPTAASRAIIYTDNPPQNPPFNTVTIQVESIVILKCSPFFVKFKYVFGRQPFVLAFSGYYSVLKSGIEEIEEQEADDTDV